MRVVLIGADFEENLGIGMIAAASEEAGHEAFFVSFNTPDEAEAVADKALELAPDVVGLAMQFQHRAHEFLRLSRRLRAGGFRGHVSAGGQFPTLAWREVIGRGHGVDTVVLHEGERTFVELLAALERGGALGDIPGLALVADDGAVFRTAPRALVDDLDALPFPRRHREHRRHFGVPFVPLMASRGCWGKCSYCSITSFYRDARAYGGGKTFRLRSPENVAEEMAVLWHEAAEPAIFCFHDDNFTLPRPEDTLARVRRMREELDRYGVGTLGIVGKARPDTITPELVQELADLGVIRLYVGVENASEAGGDHLRRGTQTRAIGAALDACDDAGIFVCYNLLVFEPQATLADVRENVGFMRAHASHPVNFCRAEPYYGTPLHLELGAVQDLGGSYLGWNYRIEDDRTELLFRIAAAAFRERNFAPQGVANRYMGVGYAQNVLEHFYDDPHGQLPALRAEADRVTRGISNQTADFLERAIDLAETLDPSDHDAVVRHTAALGLEIAAQDQRWHVALDALRDRMESFAAGEHVPIRDGAPTPAYFDMARNVVLGATLAFGSVGCGDDVVDPPPPDSGIDSMVVDPPPRDSGMDTMVVDPPPFDSGMDSSALDGGDAGDAAGDAGDAGADGDTGMVVDPPPADSGMAAFDEGEPSDDEGPRLRIIDQWRDSSPKMAERSRDVGLYAPPTVRLVVAERTDDGLKVRIEGGPAAIGTRWESDGEVEGDGRSLLWRPRDDDDRLRVAVRSEGGVAIVSISAREA